MTVSAYNPLDFASPIFPSPPIDIWSAVTKQPVSEGWSIAKDAPQKEQEVARKVFATIHRAEQQFRELANLCGIRKKKIITQFWIGAYRGGPEFIGQQDCRFVFSSTDSISLAIVVHEYMHGIIPEVQPLAIHGEAGALEESIADVFGIITSQRISGDQEDWKIYKRDLSKEVRKNYYLQQPEIPGFENDHGYVHHNSLIPSHAFYLARQTTKSYDDDGKVLLGIWWTAFTDRKDPAETFQGFAEKTLKAAEQVGGPWSAVIGPIWKGLLEDPTRPRSVRA